MKTNQEIEDIINYPEMKDIINYEEAIDYFAGTCPVPYCFGCVSNKQNGGYCNGVSEAMKFNDIALSAIRKQIPSKVKLTFYNGYCPNCKLALGTAFVKESLQTGINRFCPYCGQALDWSENEDDDI